MAKAKRNHLSASHRKTLYLAQTKSTQRFPASKVHTSRLEIQSPRIGFNVAPDREHPSGFFISELVLFRTHPLIDAFIPDIPFHFSSFNHSIEVINSCSRVAGLVPVMTG